MASKYNKNSNKITNFYGPFSKIKKINFLLTNVKNSFTSTNFKNRNSDYLFIEMFCKIQDDFSDYKNCIMDKFKLNVPIYLTVKVPFSSFCFLKQEYKTLEIRLNQQKIKHTERKLYTEKMDILKSFFSIEPFEYVTKGNSFTNHLKINCHVYLICKKSEKNIFDALKKFYPFLCDYSLYAKNYFLDFFIQQQKSPGEILGFAQFEINEFSIEAYQINMPQNSKNIVQNFTYTTDHNRDYFLKNHIYFELTPKFVYKMNEFESRQIKDHVDCFFGKIFRPSLSRDEEFLEFKHRILCFDIECGWINDNKKNIGFVDPCNAFVQCISFKEDVFYKNYSYVNPVVTFVYIPQNKRFDMAKVTKLFDESKLIVFVYTDEYLMIRDFLQRLYSSDLILGYNSKLFDLPFLIHRLKILELQNNNQYNFAILKKTNINYVRIDSQSTKYQTINSGYVTVQKIKCPQCNMVINLKSIFSEKDDCDNNNYNSEKFFVLCTCGSKSHINLIKNVTEKDISCSTDFLIEKVKKTNDAEFPFSIHYDLFENVNLKENCENAKLDTVTVFNFKQEMSSFFYKITKDQQPVFFSKIKGTFNYAESIKMSNMFTNKIKLVIFKIHGVSSQLHSQVYFRLRNMYFVQDNFEYFENILLTKNEEYFENEHSSLDNYRFYILTSGKFEKTKINYENRYNLYLSFEWWINFDKNETNREYTLQDQSDNDAICNIINNIKQYYISVGKTNELELEDQLNWKNEMHILKTVEYCTKDVELTIQLEYLSKNVLLFYSMNMNKLPLFYSMSFKDAQTSEFIYLFNLYPRVLLFLFKSLQQINIMFIDALYNEAMNNIEMEKLGIIKTDECQHLNTEQYNENYGKDFCENVAVENFKDHVLNDLNGKANAHNFEKYKIKTCQELNMEYFDCNGNFNDAIFKVPSIKKLIECISTDKENINEYAFKTSGEYDTSDYDQVNKNLNDFLNSIK